MIIGKELEEIFWNNANLDLDGLHANWQAIANELNQRTCEKKCDTCLYGKGSCRREIEFVDDQGMSQKIDINLGCSLYTKEG